jgi:hypothetical protein
MLIFDLKHLCHNYKCKICSNVTTRTTFFSLPLLAPRQQGQGKRITYAFYYLADNTCRNWHFYGGLVLLRMAIYGMP